MTTRSRRHRPPSRLRYEATHPTLSARVDLATRERLNSLAAQSGCSLSQLFLQGFDQLDRDVSGAFELGRTQGVSEGRMAGRREGHAKGFADGREQGYTEGFQRGRTQGQSVGYNEATDEFLVEYDCSVCGQPVALRVGSEDAKKAAKALTAAGWAHEACLQRTEDSSYS